MFFSSGLSNYSISLFHLFNHAFFKALLFLGMGSIIHSLNDEQDFRRMGGLIRLLPFTYVVVMIGSMSLMGMPFLTGFYSKDFLLEFSYVKFSIDGIFFYFLGIFAAFFSAYYSIRLIYWVFITKSNFYKVNLEFIHEPKFFMKMPLFVLSFCSIFIGYLFSESMNGIGNIVFNTSIYINIINYNYYEAEFSLFFVKYIPLVVSIFGIIVFFIFLKYKNIYFYLIFETKYIYIYKFFVKAMYFDILYIDSFFLFVLNTSYIYIYKYVEKRMLEFFFLFLLVKIYKFIYEDFKKKFVNLIFVSFIFIFYFYSQIAYFFEYYLVNFEYAEFLCLIIFLDFFWFGKGLYLKKKK